MGKKNKRLLVVLFLLVLIVLLAGCNLPEGTPTSTSTPELPECPTATTVLTATSTGTPPPPTDTIEPIGTPPPATDPPTPQPPSPPTPEPPPTREVWGLPIDGAYKTAPTAGFSYDPVTESGHKGIDLGPVSDVLASATGTVRLADSCGTCPSGDDNLTTGNIVIVEHTYNTIPDWLKQSLVLGNSQSIYLEYQHLASIEPPITEGQEVSLRTKIGVAGDTGNARGRPHLHLESRIGNEGGLNGVSQYDTNTYDLWNQMQLFDPEIIWNDIPFAPWLSQ